MAARVLGATRAMLNRLLGTTFTTAPGETGSGAIVRATSPALTTPNLGTPSALVLTNATGLAAAERLRIKVLDISRDMTAASGNVAYTGAGFTPKSVLASGSDGSAAATSLFGAADVSAARALHNLTVPAVDSFLIYSGSAGSFQTAVVASYDSDGVTLTWTKTGSPGGTFTGFLVGLG